MPNVDDEQAIITWIQEKFPGLLQNRENDQFPTSPALVPPVKIDTGDSKPIAVKRARLPPALLKPLRQELDRLLALGIITPSKSPWAARPRIVSKPDGTIRLCGNYIPLNNKTIKYRYPLPRIDDIIDKLGSYSWFITLDLASGFWQIPLDLESRQKTAFITPFGLFEYTVLAFGLTNAPGEFECIMETVLEPALREEKCLVYVDDIIIMGHSAQETLENLYVVLNLLHRRKFRLQQQKSHFRPSTTTQFVGYTISNAQITPLNNKIKPILAIKLPSTATQIRSFIGLVNTYRKFIPKFATYAHQLRSIIDEKNNTLGPWTPQALRAFEHQISRGNSFWILTQAKPLSGPSCLNRIRREYFTPWRTHLEY
eukprot:Gregarina_sp_Poly_1__5645@NODE_297_length_9827_cov_119_211168_g245_i1_p4_GENE_NODE_297_length_9827_cov_119_211168_g245_i1NODE_297_length_9827_cov_119_211168_g245_i1_p4_ORF_typecomplete_len370_score15_31RVT_1/PF00078_27/3_2e18DUF1177/PF06675_11/0_38_NODE_297_length_9827_cov_119_211168_g245_i178838992